MPDRPLALPTRANTSFWRGGETPDYRQPSPFAQEVARQAAERKSGEHPKQDCKFR